MSGGSPSVRDASERDAEACAVIYAAYVTDTAITFESDPPLPAEMAERIATAVRTHAWVVLENEGRVVGYAYGGPFNSRVAYRCHARSASTSSAAGGVLAAVERSTTRSSSAWPSAASAPPSRA